MQNPISLTADIRRAARNTLADALDRAVRRTPTKDAIIFEQRQWSYQALQKAANRIANYLLAQGLKAGDRVAAFGKNSDAYVLLWLACNRAGFIHVPINYALTASELKYILEQSGASAVFYDLANEQPVLQLKPELACSLYGSFHGGQETDILELATSGGATQDPAVDFDENAIAQILYTSGTTALPKGAMMTHRALLAEYNSAIVAAEIHSEDRALAALPLYHSAQMHVFLMPLLLIGACSIIISAPLPTVCFERIEQERINSFFSPPTVWISLLRHEDFDHHNLSCLHKGYYGAAIMPAAIVKELSERLPTLRLFNCYGQSEIAPLATVLSPEAHAIAPTSAGRPVLNVETRVVDTDMQDQPVGEMGEIVHRSPHLCIGYWDMPEQTAKAFPGGWFHSGDVGYFDADGFLYIVDRIKDVINTGGVLVASREVEECLYQHPAVAEVAVIAIADDKWGEAICAVVSLKAGEEASAQELLDFARGRLAPYKLPKQVHFKQDLPRNTAGKLLKRELRKQYDA